MYQFNEVFGPIEKRTPKRACTSEKSQSILGQRRDGYAQSCPGPEFDIFFSAANIKNLINTIVKRTRIRPKKPDVEEYMQTVYTLHPPRADQTDYYRNIITREKINKHVTMLNKEVLNDFIPRLINSAELNKVALNSIHGKPIIIPQPVNTSRIRGGTPPLLI